ncbi:MAG: GntR family transcriptional regulator [Burkholderiaceae bacterium]|nr:GntR family transcriptional regulator [Burkholderiaceae bacterium]MCD8516822.1 GntR family transcriptional regulator [Burkholderiaceae bacterium]MCD8538064.1 GntR family transcriptional regulator [Burkholderiaceae bacterium]MCD8565421.1 GntR family transcriptional regulator [Burkholderiaceae bacterium]
MPNAHATRPIKRSSPQPTQRIVQAITEAIAERRLMPGTKLTEAKLCEIFDVSRTLVRQALNQLSRDHLVTLEPARGAFVAKPTTEEAQQVFAVRTMLETMIVRALCKSITPAQIKLLKAHLAAETRSIVNNDIAERTRLLGEFHAVLASIHGNLVLSEILSDLLLRSSLIALMYQSSQSAEESHAEHELLVKALEDGNTALATRLMKQHLHHVERNLKLETQTTDLKAVLSQSLSDLAR